MRITKKAAVSAALLAMLAVGIAVPAALAQDATQAPATEQSQTTREERHAARQAELAQALAAELGLDTDTVAAALEKVHTQMAEQRAEHRAALQERLDAAVADGSLTQEQADALLQAHEAGVLGGLGGRGGPGGHPGPHGPDGDGNGPTGPAGDAPAPQPSA